eukprot:evm.model.scf_5205.1 EVM.evm.TU.scf_5205.1   scf_5205:405-1829(+)
MVLLLDYLYHLVLSLFMHITTMLRDAPSGVLPMTGMLGLALLLVGLYLLSSWRHTLGPPHRGTNPQSHPSNRGLSVQYGLGSQKGVCSQGEGAQGSPSPLAALRSQLVGISTVTISAPGVLLQQCGADELEEGATVKPDAIEVARELTACTQLYLLAQVSSDVGEAVVRGALEAAGVVGRGWHQVAPHRLLLCQTMAGKVAIVRQVEPELHIDADPRTIEDLQRFIPHQIHIHRQGEAMASCNIGLVAYGVSLSDALGVAVR